MESTIQIQGDLAGRVIKHGPMKRLANKVRRKKTLTDKRPTAQEILNAAR